MQREVTDPPAVSSTEALIYERPLRGRLTYRAIVAGVLVALISQIMLMLLGAAIGLTAYGSEATADVAQGVGIGFLIWMIVSLCISSFLGAWVAAACSRSPLRRDGAFHGLVTWAAASLIGLVFLGGVLSSLVSRTLSLGGQTLGAASQSPQAARIEQEVRSQLETMRAPTEGETMVATEQAAEGAAYGAWGLFLAHLLPLGFALLGGFVGARGEARAAGLPTAVPTRRRVRHERVEREREPVPPGPTVPAH